MNSLLRLHQHSNDAHWWRPLDNCTWEDNYGRKREVQNDIVVTLSRLENSIMWKVAANLLQAEHGITVLKSSPQFTKNLIATVKKVLHPGSKTAHIFGMSLIDARRDERQRFGPRYLPMNNRYKLHLPVFILKAVKCIERYGIDLDGIFLRPGDLKKFLEIKINICNGWEYTFDNYYHVYEVAQLLKTYLERMPEGIFTNELEYYFSIVKELEDTERIRVLNLLVLMLPQINRETLFLLIGLLFRITRSRFANVSSFILNHVFTPVLFRFNCNIVGERHGVIETMIDYFPAIFSLKRSYLDEMYREMNATHPRKMSEHLRRRTMQCNDESSEILDTLLIFHPTSDTPESQWQRNSIPSQGQEPNLLPCPIQFARTILAASSGFAGPRGLCGQCGQCTPSGSQEDHGTFEPSEPHEPSERHGSHGASGPSKPVAIFRLGGPTEPKNNLIHRRNCVFAPGLSTIEEQDGQETILYNVGPNGDVASTSNSRYF